MDALALAEFVHAMDPRLKWLAGGVGFLLFLFGTFATINSVTDRSAVASAHVDQNFQELRLELRRAHDDDTRRFEILDQRTYETNNNISRMMLGFKKE